MNTASSGFWVFLFSFVLFLPFMCKAQYSLPTQKVLRENQIRTIEVRQKEIGYVPIDSSSLKTFPAIDSTVVLKEVYYLNAHGLMDSIIRFPTQSGFAQKEIYSYNFKGQLTEYRVINNKGQQVLLQSIKKSRGQWLSKREEYGTLKEVNTYTEDSILIEHERYHIPEVTPSFKMTFDLDLDIMTRQWTSSNQITRIETYQWKSKDGIPTTFTHTLTEVVVGQKEPRLRQKTYEVDSIGQVVNQYVGRFDDPYLDANFFERHKMLKPIYFSDWRIFNQGELVSFQVASLLFTFDGTDKLIRYDFTYN